jgi:hypothetical protein
MADPVFREQVGDYKSAGGERRTALSRKTSRTPAMRPDEDRQYF